MRWSEICVHTTPEAVEAVSEILYAAGCNGVVIEDPEVLERNWEAPFGEMYELSVEHYPVEGVYVKGYLPVNSFLGETVDQIKESVNQLLSFNIDPGQARLTLTEVHEDEWAHAWKKYYKPVQIGRRILISPTWEEVAASPGQLLVELDPGMAFGTGTHPTTVQCAELLEQVIKGGERVADVGCGSGVLSIVAALLGAKSVLALDLDEVAVRSARENVKQNRVQEKVTVRQNNLLQGVEGPFDLIVANILAEVIVGFSTDVARHLTPGGWFLAAGVIADKDATVRQALEQAGLCVVAVDQRENWCSYMAQKLEPAT